MIPSFIRTIPKLALAAFFAVAAGGSVIASQAAHPSDSASSANLFAASAIPADAQDRFRDGYVDAHWRGGNWHGRHWTHRRWHGGYWGPGHVWRPGFWIYF
jgi:hypothetical protein